MAHLDFKSATPTFARVRPVADTADGLESLHQRRGSPSYSDGSTLAEEAGGGGRF